MPAKPAENDETRLREILLGYLLTSSIARWPGVDGLTMEAVLGRYPEAVAGGEVPDWQELLRKHPELNNALYAWLATGDRWQFTSAAAHRQSPPGGASQ